MRPFLLFLLPVIILISCSPVYVPNVRNVPLFKGAGEIQGKIFYNPLVGVGGSGFDAQGALSVTNHIALIGSYSKSQNINNDKTVDSNPYFKHHSYEAGGGYYKIFAERHALEVFGGYGEGSGTTYINYYNLQPGSPTLFNYERYFLQPTYGLILKRVSIALSARVSQVNFKDYTANGVKYTLNKDLYFFEPAATFQTNFRELESPFFSHVILTAQINGNLKFQSNDNNYDSFENKVRYTHMGASIGVGFRFGGKKKSDDN